MKKVYFAGSIRGGRKDAELYQRIITYIKQTDIVLTEHVGNLSLSPLEEPLLSGRPISEAEQTTDQRIYEQDTNWLRSCDMVVAECSTPSLGVGYELAFAEHLGKPCHLLYNKVRGRLSAMLTGNPYFHVHPYENEQEIFAILDEVLQRNKPEHPKRK